MATVEERLAFVEGRVQEHSAMINDIREALASLETRMDRRFEAIDRRFDAIDRRFESVDLRFMGIDQRLDGIDNKLTRYFTWLIGLYVTGLIAVVAALVAR
jgi:hypothetical protein